MLLWMPESLSISASSLKFVVGPEEGSGGDCNVIYIFACASVAVTFAFFIHSFHLASVILALISLIFACLKAALLTYAATLEQYSSVYNNDAKLWTRGDWATIASALGTHLFLRGLVRYSWHARMAVTSWRCVRKFEFRLEPSFHLDGSYLGYARATARQLRTVVCSLHHDCCLFGGWPLRCYYFWD